MCEFLLLKTQVYPPLLEFVCFWCWLLSAHLYWYNAIIFVPYYLCRCKCNLSIAVLWQSTLFQAITFVRISLLYTFCSLIWQLTFVAINFASYDSNSESAFCIQVIRNSTFSFAAKVRIFVLWYFSFKWWFLRYSSNWTFVFISTAILLFPP